MIDQIVSPPTMEVAQPDQLGTVASTLDRLANVGFLLVDGADPQQRSGSDLLVALRERPTLAHFDPEFVLSWTSAGGRGRQSRIDRSTEAGRHPCAWGVIRIFDRIGAFNSFVTFGGAVTTERSDGGPTVLRFSSPAPIMRWTGHSQGIDPRAADVESFFARLMVPIDFQDGAEARVATAGPIVLYAAMLADRAGRLAAEPALRATTPVMTQWVHHETNRLAEYQPEPWQAGLDLLEALGLARP